jgi:prolyl-tRNA synthetase
MPTSVERHNDEDGIIRPASVAPHQIHLQHLGKGDDVRQAADQHYADLTRAGYEVLYDDRELSAGVKFNDADLIGIPWRIAVGGRGLKEGKVEVKRRSESDRSDVPLAEIEAFLKENV